MTVAYTLKTTGASKALALKGDDGTLVSDPSPAEEVAPDEAVVLLLSEGERPVGTARGSEVECSLDSSLYGHALSTRGGTARKARAS